MNEGLRVWIVDDDKIFRFTTEKYLHLVKGVEQVESFRYVEDALDRIKQNREISAELPDVILLDVNLPILDGWDFVEEYGKLKPQLAKLINIFIVSSSIDERDSAKAKDHPDILDYVIKPLDEKQLSEVVAKSVEKQQQK